MKDVIEELQFYVKNGVPRVSIDEWYNSLTNEERQVIVTYVEKRSVELVVMLEAIAQYIVEIGKSAVTSFTAGFHGQV